MSVDDRLRAAFGEDEDGWIDVEQALVSTTVRARRDARRRVGAVVGSLVAAAVVVAGVVAAGERTETDDPVTPAPTVSVGALEGKWRTAPITKAEVRRALAGAGLGRYTSRLMQDLPRAPWTLTVEVGADGDWSLRLNGSRRTLPLDDEQVEVSGSLLEITPDELPGANITTTYHFSVDRYSGSRWLTLFFVGTTEVSSDGIPGEVYHRAFYTSLPFQELP